MAEEELDQLRPFDSRSILKAIRELRYGAELVTRNRKTAHGANTQCP